MTRMESADAVLHHVFDNVYLAHGDAIPESDGQEYHCFSTQELDYTPFCDDFGPMNAISIIDFIQILDSELAKCKTGNLVYCADFGRRSLTNAAFLMGSYLIMTRNETPEEVQERFSSLCPNTFEGYRDATFSDPTFELTLLDCWRGLARGMSMGWIQLSQTGDNLWGNIIADEYAHYDNPLNGDLHIVVPDRFVAFKGPKDLPAGREYRDARGYRDFSPKYYIDIFQELNVKAVVRLNEAEYSAETFEANGIRHHDLEFDDCTAPPESIVARFFEIVDQTKGLVAIHCKAGLGRTGTLIALDLMRRCHFTAREAMGWLRIMRPGSVIGEQQHYLVAVEAAVTTTGRDLPSSLPPPARHSGQIKGAKSSSSAVVAAQVAEAMDRRAAARIKAQC